MSTGFVFEQRLHLCSVWNLRIILVFQLRIFKVGFSGARFSESFRARKALYIKCFMVFEMAFRARNVSGTFEKQTPGPKTFRDFRETGPSC